MENLRKSWRKQTLIKKRSADIKCGSEGPRHDPYGYTEARVQINEHMIVLHEGLALWIKIDGKDYPLLSQEGIFDLFYELTGYADIQHVERCLELQRRSTLNWCCNRYAEWMEGMPGESLCRCAKCGKFVDYSFNESAII